MTEKTKSLIRHILTMASGILVMLGLASAAGIVEFTLANLDAVWNSILVVIGFITGLKGYKFGRVETT